LEKAVKGFIPKDANSPEVASENLDLIDKKTFANIVNGHKPTKDFKLKEDISVSSLVEGGNLKVDIGTGQKVIVAKGTSMTVGGKDISAVNEAKELPQGEQVISGTITKGAVFSSGIVFKTA